MSQRIPRDRAVFVISVAAEIAGMHPQTLRIYERKGLLDPERTDGGSRRYSEIDIGRLQRIQELTSEGLNLAGVKRVLELESKLAATRAEIKRLETEAEQAVARARREHRRDLVPLKQSLITYRDPRRR